MIWVVESVLFFGLAINLAVLFVASFRLLVWLIVIEKMKVLLLFCSLLVGLEGFRVYYVVMMVVFTVEVVLALVVLTRLWDFGGLTGFVGW